MGRPLFIFGAGETATLAYEYFTREGVHKVVGFVVDDEFCSSAFFLGLPVVPFSKCLDVYPPTDYDAFVAVAYGKLNHQRRQRFERLKALGYTCASCVASTSSVWPNVTIGENCLVFEHCTLQPFVVLGNNTFVWNGSNIAHRTVVGAHCWIAPGSTVSGFCDIGENTFLGAGCCIADNVHIGRENFIMLGSAVGHDTPPGSVWKGNPAVRKTYGSRVYCHVSEGDVQ